MEKFHEPGWYRLVSQLLIESAQQSSELLAHDVIKARVVL
jgi:hypothetical protein